MTGDAGAVAQVAQMQAVVAQQLAGLDEFASGSAADRQSIWNEVAYLQGTVQTVQGQVLGMGRSVASATFGAQQAQSAASTAQQAATAAQSTADAAKTAGASTAADLAALRGQVQTIQLTPGPPGQDGAPGAPGSPGTPGVDGRSVYLRNTASAVQWRQDGTTWTDLVPHSAITGPAGTDGQNGVQGVPGLPGANGVDGKPPELRLTSSAVQWRQQGGTWADLVPLDTITGPAGRDGMNGAPGQTGTTGAPGADGKSAELRINGTNVEWRQAGGTWATLVPLATITGPAGKDGTNGVGVKGDQGIQGVQGAPGTPADMTRVSALEISVSALQAKTVLIRRASPPTTLPLLALGVPYDAAVTWDTAMPDTAYAVAAPIVSALVGKATLAVTAKTTTGCTVRVTPSVAVAAGTVLDLTAWRYA